MIEDATDPKSVSEGLLRMIQFERKHELGKHGRKTVKQKFVLSQQAEKYIKCFQEYMK